MIQVNGGNVLKFTTNRAFLRHNQPGQDRTPFGIRCLQSRLLPFQFFFLSGAGSATWKLVSPTDSTGASGTAMTAGDLTVTAKAGGGGWITWAATSALTTDVPECGFWEVWLTVDGVTYYSEVLHVMPDEQVSSYRMSFLNTTDKGNVLYQNGYTQRFYPTAVVWGRPLIDREVQPEVDGYENEVTRFSRTVARYRFEVPDIPDYLIPFFAKCGDLSSVSYGTGVAGQVVNMANVSFESRPQGAALNIGVFTFDAEVEAYNGCQENYELA